MARFVGIALLVAAAVAVVSADLLCPKPAVPQYGYISKGRQYNYEVGSIVHYACNRGYRLYGRSWIRCAKRGRVEYWDARIPVCKPIGGGDSTRKCSGLRDPRFGDVWVSGLKPGSVAKYTCNRGFTLKGNNQRTCLNSGSWTGSMPSCVRQQQVVKCGNLGNPANGAVNVAGNLVGSKATYRCNSGFQLNGNSVRQCQRNGRWSGNEPTCQRKIVRCRNLDNIQYGQVQLSGTTVGSKARYTCNNGFELKGNSVRQCQNNGRWSGREPVCKRRIIDCGDLDDPANGDVDLDDTTVGSKARYSCDDGFELKGNSVRQCQNNGRWSGQEPVCKRRVIDCGDLDDPANGDVDLDDTTVGSKARYSCDDGFELKGNSVRQCQNNGRWSGQEPVCKRRVIDCGDLDDPAYGQVDLDGTTVGSKARYSCDDGFVLNGDSVRKCQNNGRWSGQEPVCRRIDCGGLQDPRYGVVNLEDTIFGSIATYECDDGFILKGDNTRKCQSNGQWSGNEPVCERRVVDCGPLGHPKNGRVHVRATTEGSTAAYYCFRGYQLKGPSHRVCEANGYWSEEEPVCVYGYIKHDYYY